MGKQHSRRLPENAAEGAPVVDLYERTIAQACFREKRNGVGCFKIMGRSLPSAFPVRQCAGAGE
jgi:hypothetical protein